MRASWAALREAGLPSQLDHRGASNAVHLTVVSAPTIPQPAVEAARRVLGPLLPLRVRVSGLLVLGGSRVTIARAVDVDDTAVDAVLRVRALVPDRQHPGWLPHLTLARRLPRERVQEAVDVLGWADEVLEFDRAAALGPGCRGRHPRRVRSMKLGLQVNRFSWPGAPASTGATWRAVARDADQCGLASLWVMDHFFQISVVGPPELDMLEGYTTLAHAAAVTEQIELGTLVTGVTYRHPGILLKTVTTLDVLSGGRAWLGIGAAWNEEEHRGLGVPYPSTRERFRLLEDTLQLAHRMFADDDSPFEGEAISLERPMNHPQPVRRVADHGRRRGRAAHPEAGGAVRRRVQPVRPRARP